MSLILGQFTKALKKKFNLIILFKVFLFPKRSHFWAKLKSGITYAL